MNNKLPLLLALILIATTTNAECDGNLDFSYISDVNGLDEERIDFTVETDEENSGFIRVLNLRLYDPYDKVVVERRVQFDHDDQDTDIDFEIRTNDNFLDGEYKVRAEMKVYPDDKLDEDDHLKCGKIKYSRDFEIHTDREYYSHQPFRLDVDVSQAWSGFDIRKRNCTSGYCVQVNMSGNKPLNMTLDPLLLFSPPKNVTNISITAEGCYTFEYLDAIIKSTTNTSKSLVECFDSKSNLTKMLERQLTESKSLQSKMLDNFDTCQKTSQEFTEYRENYPYTTAEIAIPSILIGMVLLFLIIVFYNRRGHREDPQEVH